MKHPCLVREWDDEEGEWDEWLEHEPTVLRRGHAYDRLRCARCGLVYRVLTYEGYLRTLKRLTPKVIEGLKRPNPFLADLPGEWVKPEEPTR